MTNSALRSKILEMVYERFKEHPYYRITPKELQETLAIGLKELHYNIIYLEEKGLIELQKPLEGSLFVGARITPKGIDLVEDECQFEIMFPKYPEEKTATHIFDELAILIKEIESADIVGGEVKEIIVEEIKDIDNELKKSEPSYSYIRNLIGKIKEANSEIYEKVMVIIRHPVITKKLRESARKELENM